MSLEGSESLTVLLKDGLGGRRQARLPVPINDMVSLLEAVRQAFQPELNLQDFCLTSGSRVIDSDAMARKLRAGGQLQVCIGSAQQQRNQHHTSSMPASSTMPSSGRSRPPAGPSRPATSTAAGPAAASGSARKDVPSSLGSAYKPPAKERISFVPHPKTLTMAGDYEYFAARGHHPFAFALAELVDNALRATKCRSAGGAAACTAAAAGVEGAGQGASGAACAAAAAAAGAGAGAGGGAAGKQSRDITISLVVNERGTAGLIRVQDNGRGMSPKELGEWAVMNLSMEDRGLLPNGGQLALEQAGGGRYLSGDLSFFGVGSKNAAFFMGSSVKLATRQTGGDSVVHELHIAGAELERRYKCGENVYEEDLVHRHPGDESTLSEQESAFGVARSWVSEEAAAEASFTRVTIADLRPDVLSLVRDSDSGAMICRDLAHLYHYYLHGPAGNVAPAAAGAGGDASGSGVVAGTGADAATGAGGSGGSGPLPGMLPGGEPMPNIVVEYLVGSRQVWQRQLAAVDDDLESRYVRAAEAKMEFALDVPGKGTVEGVLWYFPFVDGAETVPCDQGAAAYSGGPGGAGGRAGGGGAGILTLAQELPTQLTLHGAAAFATQLARAGRTAVGMGATQAGQLPEQMKLALVDMLGDEDLGETDSQARGNVPMFETFWQGRLIPGSGLEILPFIEAVRSKMRGSSSGKDFLPDEVFSRIRGALFFGPAWRVTRNKLTFRDPLPQLLASATTSDRAIDKRLREWLRDCHTRLDRIIRFQGPADVELKAMVRKELGEAMTGFKCVCDGTRTICAGDVVRLATKPAALGRVKYFAVPQASAAEGVYATGFVTFTGVPTFIHGPTHNATLALRRVEEVLTPTAVEEFVSKERSKLPSLLRLEPLRLASGRRIDMAVGEAIPESTATLHSAAGQRLTRTFLQGQKVALRVQQRLIFMGPRRPSAYCSGLAAAALCDGDAADGVRDDQDVSASGAGQPTAAPVAAAGGDVAPMAQLVAAAAAAAATAAAEAEVADGAGKRGRKRRKKRGAAEEDADEGQPGTSTAAAAAGGKENLMPPPAPAGGGKRAKRGAAGAASSAAGACITAAAPAGANRAAAGGPLAEGIGEVVLVVENKTPNDNAFQFSKITGGLNRSGTYFLEYRMLPDLPTGCDPAGSPEPLTVWSRTVLYATAGPAVRFEMRGEARAVLAAKSVALGEALPPLQLVCYDAADNEVALADVAGGGGGGGAAQGLAMELVRPGGTEGEAATSQGLAEVKLEWQAVATPEALVLEGLRVTGCGQCGGGGMQLFGGRGTAGGQSSLEGADRSPGGGQCAQQVAVWDVDLQLRISLPNMPCQVLPLKLRPGAPAALRLLPGHPFSAADAAGDAVMGTAQPLQPACVMNGEALPEFQVRVLDAWGNPTCPAPDLPSKLELEGPMLQSSPASFEIDAQGMATLQGVRVTAPDTSYIGVTQDLRLNIRCTARGAGPRAALELAESAAAAAAVDTVAAVADGAEAAAAGGAKGWSTLVLPVMVQPCTLPAGLQILYRGQPVEVGPSSSGEGLTALLRDVPAGSRLTGLSLVFLDEGGRAAEPGFKGKLQVSWSKGSKKVTVSEEGAVLDLQPLAVKEQAGGEPQCAWIRFLGEGPLAGSTLETALELLTVAGTPAAWGVSVVEWGNANGGGDGSTNVHSQVTENLGYVSCGAAICLEIEAHDAHNNRCSTWTGSGPRPTPVVEPVREEGDASLVFDTADWVSGWELSQQTGCEVYHVRLALGGSVGPVKLVVKDTQGPGGESLLQPDALPVELQPGRATGIAFEGPQLLQCGTRSGLGDIRVRVMDDWGNTVEAPLAAGGRGNKEAAALELTMQTSAIASDGSGNAAKVIVTGSNKAKVIKGAACFRDVKLEGAPGTYALRVASASRKVALREASLMVEVVAQNVVRYVALAPCSLPQEPLEPGMLLELQVQVTTEDGQPLPYETAAAGLCLRLKAPSAEAAAAARGEQVGVAHAAAAAAGGGGGGAGGSSANACTVVMQPQAQEEGASQASMEMWTFVTPGSLVFAGEYTVTAEYLELRSELARSLPKSEQAVRSVSHALQMLPGAPVTATLEQDARASPAGALTITNGSDGRGRALLTGAAVQLRDEHGNAVALDGVFVRWVLGWPSVPEEGEGEDGGDAEAARELQRAREVARAAGAELPVLQGASSDTPWLVEALTDSRGRVFFREVAVVEGSGRVSAAADAPQALHLELRMEVALQAGGGGPTAGGSGSSGWLHCWTAPVVFSDDAARGASLQRLSARREELAAVVAQQEGAKGEAERVLHEARRSARHAQRELERVLSRAGPALTANPQSSAEAQEMLQRLREEHQRAVNAPQPRRDTIAARFGASTSGMVMGLHRCLAAEEGRGEVVGVIAQLATVDNPRLSALLAAAFSSTLQILVVRTYECIKRLRDMLTTNRSQVPSMLSIGMVQAFTGDGARQLTDMAAAMRNVSPEASALQEAACDGADPPLAMALPHTRTLIGFSHDRVRAVAGAGPAADEWPHGCLGYAVNLVRPGIQGQRATVFYSQMGRTLIFETLDQAAAYRAFVVQTLGNPAMGDVYTLDGGKLSGRGVVVGSGFRVVALEDAAVRFGAAQSSQAALAKQLSQQVSDVEAVAAALEAAEGTAEAEAEAQQQAEAAGNQLAEAQAEVGGELQALEAEIARLAGGQPANATGAGGGGGGRQRGCRAGKRAREAVVGTAAAEEAEAAATTAPDELPGGPVDAGAAGAEGGAKGQRSKRAKGQGRMAAMH